MLDWNDLRFVLALARSGTLSGAARTLAVEHSTVGRRLGAIEASLQTRLFDRTAEGYAPTAAGEIVLAHCASIELRALALEREVLGRDASPSGIVRVSAMDGCIDEFVLPHIGMLRQNFPDLVLIAAAEVQLADLSRREADIAIRYVPPKAPNLIGRKLAEVASALYASRAYVKRRGKLKSATALDQHDLVGLAPEYSFASDEQWMMKHGGGGRIMLRVSTQRSMLAAVRAGAGIGIIECYFADQDPELVRVWEEPLFRDTWWLVIHADVKQAARIRAVVGFLEQLTASHRDRLLGFRSSKRASNRRRSKQA